MGFQVCPLCNGKGKIEEVNCPLRSCPVCKGRNIIDEVTGLPPSDKATKKQSSIPRNYSDYAWWFQDVKPLMKKDVSY